MERTTRILTKKCAKRKSSIMVNVSKDNFFRKILEFLFYVFIFILPWQTRWIFRDAIVAGNPFEYGRMSLYAFDIIFVAILIIFLFSAALARTDKFEIKNWKPRGINIILLFFCLFVLLTVLWADEKLVSLYAATRIILGCILFNLARKINFSKIRLALVIVITAALQGFLAIWQFLNQSIWQSKWLGLAGQTGRDLGAAVIEFDLERFLRAYGSLPHPNIFGGLLVLCLPALIYLTAKIKDKYQIFFIILSLGFIWLGVFFSFSRSAWLMFFLVNIFGIVWLWQHGESCVKKFAKGLYIYGLLLLFVFIIACWPLVKTRLNIGDTQRLEIKSNIERLNSIKQAKDIIKDNWLLGTGIGNYTFTLKKNYHQFETWDLQPAHNAYLLVLAELGVVGILLAILLNCCIIRMLVSGKMWYRLYLLLVLYGLMLFDHYFWTTAFGVYLWFLMIGILITSPSLATAKSGYVLHN